MKKFLTYAVITVVVYILGGCGSDKAYKDAVAAYEKGDYTVAINLMETMPDHKDPQNIRLQSENAILRYEAANALQKGRYASVIQLLDILPDFPEAKAMREEAEAGIKKADITLDIKT